MNFGSKSVQIRKNRPEGGEKFWRRFFIISQKVLKKHCAQHNITPRPRRDVMETTFDILDGTRLSRIHSQVPRAFMMSYLYHSVTCSITLPELYPGVKIRVQDLITRRSFTNTGVASIKHCQKTAFPG